MQATTVDHYMVDYLDDAGHVRFANDTNIQTLAAARALARKVSKGPIGACYVVAFATAPKPANYPARDFDSGLFTAIGHIGYFNGRVDHSDGVVA